MSDVKENKAADAHPLSQRDFNRLIFTVLAIGLVVLMILGGSIAWLSVKFREYNGWVEHTYVAEQRIASFQAAVERMETTRRGYLLAPSQNQFAAYRASRADMAASLYSLAAVVQDNPRQVAKLQRIKPILAWKTKVNDDSVEAVRRGDRALALRRFAEEQALQPLIGVRSETAAMMAEEQRLLGRRYAQEGEAVRVLALVALATAVLLGLLSISAILVMRRFAADLTRAEAELRLLNAGLEQRIAERTADVTRANQEIQRFAYIVSHDLRSPLVNVMGFTSELEGAMKPLRALVRWIEERDLEGRLPPEIKRSVDQDIPEAIDFIRSSTRKMDGLIGAILKLSREGQRMLKPEWIDLHALVSGLFATVQHRLTEIGGEARIEGTLPSLTTDRLALEQILGNLIDNAVKYHSPRRPLLVTVKGEERAGRVVIEVADNGRGIAEKDHDRVFELFRRSGPQTQPGEGIGLAHVRATAHRLGGSIACVSALDQGAVFRVSLPKALTLAEDFAA
jgi:signal transduction histidine kinase